MRTMPHYFLIILTHNIPRLPTLSSLCRSKITTNYFFLDVVIDNSHPDFPLTSVFHKKKTYTGLLTSFFSFLPFSYKIGLICTSVDTAFKINGAWNGFHTRHPTLTNIYFDEKSFSM